MNALVPFTIAVSAVALLAGCRNDREAVASDVPRLEVKASVAAPQTVVVTAPLDGRVQTVHAKEGAGVKAGDVVVTLANPTIERDLAYSRAQLAIAEQRLRGAARPVMRDGERLRLTEELVRKRKARLDRYRELHATRDVSAQDLENAEAEYLNASRELAAMQTSAPLADSTLLRLEVDRARAEIAVVEDRRRQLTVQAPIAGVVTRQIAGEGAAVYTREALLEIANASTLDIRGAVAPELMRYVRVGMPVEVKVFTVPPRRFTANIRSVVPPTDPSGATIVVSVPNPDGVLQPGTPATITVR